MNRPGTCKNVNTPKISRKKYTDEKQWCDVDEKEKQWCDFISNPGAVIIIILNTIYFL